MAITRSRWFFYDAIQNFARFYVLITRGPAQGYFSKLYTKFAQTNLSYQMTFVFFQKALIVYIDAVHSKTKFSKKISIMDFRHRLQALRPQKSPSSLALMAMVVCTKSLSHHDIRTAYREKRIPKALYTNLHKLIHLYDSMLQRALRYVSPEKRKNTRVIFV